MPDMPETMAVRERFFHNLATTIAGDAALTVEGWKQLVLVSQISDSTADMTGFCYTGDGRAIAVSPSDFAIFEVIERLREAMAAADAGSAVASGIVSHRPRNRQDDGRIRI